MLSQTSRSVRGGINLQFAYLRTCHIVVVASFNLLTVFHSLRGVAVAKSTGKVFFGNRKRTFPMEEMLNQFSCQWERQKKGKQRVFPRQRRLSSLCSRGGNWKQMEIDENFPPRHGSLASRAMVDVFKTFLLPEIKIRWHLRNEKRQTWALAARPRPALLFSFSISTEACWICQETHVRLMRRNKCWIVFGTDE